MNKNCDICSGVGWVCERHPNCAWTDDYGCMCSAGIACVCNPDERELEEADAIEVVFWSEEITVH
jgi:hypothetical protein